MGILTKNVGECFSEIFTKWIPKTGDSFHFLPSLNSYRTSKFVNISKVIHGHSKKAAREFAALLGKNPSHDTVHFFFDYFLCFYFVIAKPDQLPTGKDSKLKVIDRMHSEYYGRISSQIVQSITDIWIEHDPCFFNSLKSIIRYKNRYHIIVPIAARSIDKNMKLNESNILYLIPLFKHIQYHKLRNIDSAVSGMLA